MIKSFSQIFKNQLMMSFNLNVLFRFNFFMISNTFFFIMIAEQCTDIKYAAPKMSLRSVRNKIGKNSSIKNHVLFSKNVINFLSTFFCMFLINMNIFNNSFKTWFLILIYLIRRHNFFLFATFVSIVFQNFKIFVLRMIFCLWSFIWK